MGVPLTPPPPVGGATVAFCGLSLGLDGAGSVGAGAFCAGVGLGAGAADFSGFLGSGLGVGLGASAGILGAGVRPSWLALAEPLVPPDLP